MPTRLLQPGAELRTEESGAVVTVTEFITKGGQGEVHRGTLGGYPVAIKWYFPQMIALDPRLLGRLREAARQGPPSPLFLWPYDVVAGSGLSGYGYVMPLLESRFLDGRRLIDPSDPVEPSFRALTTVGCQLAVGYGSLHSRGWCYRDISMGNIALDPATGEVRICDNDNVDTNGERGLIKGTPMYMAPEIVLDQALPNTSTDLWSLAVLLFMSFTQSHPLLGRRELAFSIMGDEALHKLFGSEARFIFDPADDSNAPVQGVHDRVLAYWGIFPRFARDLFTRAFTTGLREPQMRVRESEWRDAMLRLRDNIQTCPSCHAENFLDPADPQRACWHCSRPLPPPLMLTIGRTQIILSDGAELYSHHLGDSESDFRQPLACVTRHPQRPELMGLKNLGDDSWQVELPDGDQRQVDPGRTIVLRAGAQIMFGRVKGMVR